MELTKIRKFFENKVLMISCWKNEIMNWVAVNIFVYKEQQFFEVIYLIYKHVFNFCSNPFILAGLDFSK